MSRSRAWNRFVKLKISTPTISSDLSKSTMIPGRISCDSAIRDRFNVSYAASTSASYSNLTDLVFITTRSLAIKKNRHDSPWRHGDIVHNPQDEGTAARMETLRRIHELRIQFVGEAEFRCAEDTAQSTHL